MDEVSGQKRDRNRSPGHVAAVGTGSPTVGRKLRDLAMPEAKVNAPGRPCPATGHRASVALIEDDAAMRSLLADVLRAEGYLVDEFPDGLVWLEAWKGTLDGRQAEDRWQVIVCDVRMPGLDGLSVLRIAAGLTGDRMPPVIVITAFGDEDLYAEARRSGAAAVLDKPFRLDDLIAKIREIAPRRWRSRAPGECSRLGP